MIINETEDGESIYQWEDHLFVHEYGHYIQSQWLGPLYLRHIGLPSLFSATFGGSNHLDFYTETNASRLGAKHFHRKYGPGKKSNTEGKYFEIDSFQNGTVSNYNNPRTGKPNNKVYPF